MGQGLGRPAEPHARGDETRGVERGEWGARR